MIVIESSATEAIPEPPQGNRSRNRNPPLMTYDSDEILYFFTVDDVDQFCEEYEHAKLTDDEMEQLVCILHEDYHWFHNLYDAVDDVRQGGLRRDLASRDTRHADALA